MPLLARLLRQQSGVEQVAKDLPCPCWAQPVLAVCWHSLLQLLGRGFPEQNSEALRDASEVCTEAGVHGAGAAVGILKLWCLSLAAQIPREGCRRGGPPHAGHLCHRRAEGPRAGGDRRLAKIQLCFRSEWCLWYEKTFLKSSSSAKPVLASTSTGSPLGSPFLGHGGGSGKVCG